MLTISKALSSKQARTYHKEEFIAADQAYWKQDGAVIGQWQGRLAARLGLSGSVMEDQFARIAEGQHPLSGDQLVRHREVSEYSRSDGSKVSPVEHRAGWDATFSAPKSVSLSALVGGDGRIRVAHREAVAEALNELEQYVQARMGGNRPAETTGSFVVAKFEHDTARPVDAYAAPQLHTHAVIFNVTEIESGQTRALQERALFESQQFATAVYQSELTWRLRALGYEITTGRSGAPEIKGYSQEYLDASSPRSQQIRTYLEKTGYEGPKAAQIAAHSTRNKKETIPIANAVAAHRRVAEQFGFEAERVVLLAQEGSSQHGRALPPLSVTPDRALSYARDRIFEREAVVDERHLYRDALRRGMGEMRIGEIRATLSQRLASGEFLHAARPTHSSGEKLTTAEMIEAEREVVERVLAGRNQMPPLSTIQQAVQLTESHAHLTASQGQVVREVLLSRDQVQGIQGRAGAGKTGVLAAIREGAERNGLDVEGFAPTSRATNQLKEIGIKADTLQGYLARRNHAAIGLQKPRMFLLDESSLSSTLQMRDFLQSLRDLDRVILVGDMRQHQAVDAGKPFEQLQRAGMQTSRLDTILRQKDPDLQRVVEYLASGEATAGLTLLQDHGRVHEIPDHQERVRTIARTYCQKPEETLIVAPDNLSRRAINEAVRAELMETGHLDSDQRTVTVLQPRSELAGADRAWAAQYQAGDVLRYRRGSAKVGIEAGAYSRVLNIDSAKHLIQVRLENGTMLTYDPSRLKGVDIYKPHEMPLSTGERIVFTAQIRELGIANRTPGIVRSFAQDGHLTVQLENGKEVTLDERQMRHLDHGYALTSHAAQGTTASRVLVHVHTQAHRELISERFAYVAISRASHEAAVYTNDFEHLKSLVSRAEGKSSALETVEQSMGRAGASLANAANVDLGPS